MRQTPLDKEWRNLHSDVRKTGSDGRSAVAAFASAGKGGSYAANEYGAVIQAVARHNGTPGDYAALTASEYYRSDARGAAFSMLVPSITPYKGACLAGLFPISSRSDQPPVKAYIYVELDPDFILDVLEPYAALNPIFVGTANGEKLLNANLSGLGALDLTNADTGSVVFDGSVRRKVEAEPR